MSALGSKEHDKLGIVHVTFVLENYSSVNIVVWGCVIPSHTFSKGPDNCNQDQSEESSERRIFLFRWFIKVLVLNRRMFNILVLFSILQGSGYFNIYLRFVLPAATISPSKVSD